MTVNYTVFDTATGEIIRTGSTMTVESAQLQGSKPGTSVVFVDSNPVSQVIDPGNPNAGPQPKPPMAANGTPTVVNKTAIVANGNDAVVISNIPVGAKYDVYLPVNLGLVQPPDGIVNDGTLILTTTVPGIYSVKLSFQNYLDFSVTFNAS